jgi:hypothetical protein
MKKLILVFILTLNSVYGQKIVELSDTELSNKFISTVKDLQIQSTLEKTAEFNECRSKSQYDPNDPNTMTEVSKAEECFKQKLAGKTPAQIADLSKKLGLQSYGLVESQNVKDVEKYLADKMYQVMTGVDRTNTNQQALLESMKFKNKSLVDQKDFIDLYTTQLGKNALFEISRFCFENFRNNTKTDVHTFAEHWSDFISSPTPEDYNLSITTLTDRGEPKFDQIITTDKNTIYKSVFKSISNDDKKATPEVMGKFFGFCSKNISGLCSQYEADHTHTKPGGNACLAKARLQEIRKTLANMDQVSKQFQQMDGSSTGIKLDGNGQVKVFDRGNSNAMASIDNLTNFSSSDVINGGTKNSTLGDKAKACAQTPEIKACEGFLIVDDSVGKVEHDIALEMTLKKEAELERVRQLVKAKDQSLDTYLTENGYFDMIDKVHKGEDIEKLITENFDAKKQAAIDSIANTIGKRQVSTKDDNTTKEVAAIGDAAKETIEERARLAQVVLFNNIITSHLDLVKRDPTTKVEEKIGRNINVLDKEVKSLEQAQVDVSLFSGLKDAVGQSKPANTKDNSIVGLGMLDSILGKPAEKIK